MLLLLSSIMDSVVSDACSFEISVDGAAFLPATRLVPGPAQFLLDAAANVVDIRATAQSADFWPVQGRFQVTGPGTLTPTDTPDNFAPTIGAGFGPLGGVAVTVYLSRLRDATSACLTSLATVPPNRTNVVPAGWPPTKWEMPAVPNIHYIDEPPLIGPLLSTTPMEIVPQSTEIIFERKGVRVPRLIAVSWPDSVPIYSGAGATPMLVYFHANMGQNVQNGYYLGSYPFHFDYVFYGLWNYLHYRESPLIKWPYSLGLPYQIAVTDKPVVLVLPCSSASQEIGTFREAGDMAIVLKDIQATMFRRAGIYTPPDIGRLALGGFSGSTGLVAGFLNSPANRAHSLMQQNLREVYAFDPPDTEIIGLVGALTQWLASAGPDAMARVYRQGESPVLPQLLAPISPLPARPFVTSTPDQRITLGLIPAQTWRAASAAHGAASFGFTFEEVHHMFPSMLLTDALRRSGF